MHHCASFCKSHGCIFDSHDMVHAIDGKINILIGFKPNDNFKGLWKLSYPHCMWYQPNKNVDFGLDIPPVCTNQPKTSSAFCDHHSKVSENLGVPSSLRAFLKYCGVHGKDN